MLSSLTNSSESTWLKVTVLTLVGLVAFSSRLFSVIRFESIIHEFDPWFNFRATRELVDNGYYAFINWYDRLAWYPLARNVGPTVYPGLLVTSGLFHWLVNALHFPIDIRDVCVFLAPVFSAFTATATYLLTAELKDPSAGLLAAMFIGIAPGYISRSVAGSYDNEGIAIFLLMMTFFLWVRAVKRGSALWAAAAALFYFWMVASWGGYAFIINLIPLHVLALLLMGRYSTRLYISYATFYVVGTLASMQVPFVGTAPIRTAEHMGALGVFGLLQAMAFGQWASHVLPARRFRQLWLSTLAVLIGLGFAGLVGLTMLGWIAPWTGRFYSLWDTGYAKIHIPLIASVSEHQPTPWVNFFLDLHALVALFPAGVYFCFRRLRDEHVFAIMYAVVGAYFAGVMIRLMLTLTPIVCICAAIAVSEVLDVYLKTAPSPEADLDADADAMLLHTNIADADADAEAKPSLNANADADTDSRTRSPAIPWDIRLLVVLPLFGVLCHFVTHCTWVTSTSYSSPSVVLASQGPNGARNLIDDFREAYSWLRQNTPADAKILAWWDYGYQITGMANRTTIVDNNTWNNTHIATVGKALACTEDVAYPVLRKLDVDYLLVIFGGVVGYSGDDINKFLWMIRIAEGVYPDDVSERAFFTDRGEFLVTDAAPPAMRDSLMYKMSYYRFKDMFPNAPPIDRVRGVPVARHDIQLNAIEEAYSTQHLIVRLFRVKRPDNLGRSQNAAASFGKKRKVRSRRVHPKTAIKAASAA
ncbi:hypothetical protein CXG81DRAFT_15376 [Caulochytrium protostelioides]|uniref:dolichyl-diphosphooligosaccharide--protein glycotransferase n=1 Tax=Caulochytrium protostelioides TaxID=1555241 RepID=A0A4P9X2P8_9FUNG|nr:hypothetical protein CXG81DRAFT_15376 [Caulochytrium protostelioides]|eukprot:RKO98836.1 hypothetical protein CXG81DRAFT_15376 [Caulochytrium protostelioides]